MQKGFKAILFLESLQNLPEICHRKSFVSTISSNKENLTPIVSDIPFFSMSSKGYSVFCPKILDDGDRRSSYHKRVAKREEQRGNKDIKVLFELHPKRDQIDQGAPFLYCHFHPSL